VEGRRDAEAAAVAASVDVEVLSAIDANGQVPLSFLHSGAVALEPLLLVVVAQTGQIR
jgi:hypothetical protein